VALLLERQMESESIRFFHFLPFILLCMVLYFDQLSCSLSTCGDKSQPWLRDWGTLSGYALDVALLVTVSPMLPFLATERT
jgi:hypothetical protein